MLHPYRLFRPSSTRASDVHEDRRHQSHRASFRRTRLFFFLHTLAWTRARDLFTRHRFATCEFLTRAEVVGTAICEGCAAPAAFDIADGACV